MSEKKRIDFSANKTIQLNNKNCPYCSVMLTDDIASKEHVIGRRFVPRGYLHGQWNLILKACNKCNDAKSDLEDDISAITLAGYQYFNSDKSNIFISNDVKRKIKNSFSRKTRKLVKDSQEELEIKGSLTKQVNIGFNLVSPPQVNPDRAFKLACLQMMAFFYYITYDCNSRKGRFWTGGFHPVEVAIQPDWGNSTQRYFMDSVLNWDFRWIGITASGFYKSIIRRHPNEECFSWAIEWNKYFRLIGFFGNRCVAQKIVNSFPVMKRNLLSMSDNTVIRYRQEIELDEKNDSLFNID